MDEYVLVCFDEDGRQVPADGGLAGLTNRLFVLATGSYTFSIAGGQDCAPMSQTVWSSTPGATSPAWSPS